MTHKELPVQAAELQRAVGSTESCTSAVVDTLRAYLLQGTKDPNLVQASRGASRRPKTLALASGAPKGSRVRTKEKADIQILPDGNRKTAQPNPHERFQLATEVVNVTLKALTEAVKKQTNPGLAQPKKTHKHPQTEDTEPEPAVREALHQICANQAKPPRRRRSSCTMTVDCQSGLLAQAGCACVAFAVLREMEAQKSLGIELPPLQLETGMAALIGKLITLGFVDMAMKELRIQKQRLASFMPSASDKGQLWDSANSESVQVKSTADQECLASLLRFPSTIAKGPVLSLIITTQLHVLKVIAAVKRPPVTEMVFGQIQMSKPQSPGRLILRQVTDNVTQVKATAARQLESLTQTVFSLCPSVSSGEDEVAANPKKSVSPQIALKIQQLAFEIRSESWRLSNHKGDARKELYEPLLRCLGSFCRRSSLPTHEKYEVAKTCFRSLQACFVSYASGVCGRPLLNIYEILANLAQEGMIYEEAIYWIQQSLDLPDKDIVSRSRICSLCCRVAAMQIRLAQKKLDMEVVTLALKDPIANLEGDISGDSDDLDELVTAINDLRRVVFSIIVEHCNQANTGKTTLPMELACRFLEFVRLATCFLSRYATKDLNSDLRGKLALRQVQTHNIVKRVLYATIESLASISKLVVSEINCWQRLENGLQECTRLVLTLENDPVAKKSVTQEPGFRRQPMVLISNAYWSRFLYLRHVGEDAGDMLKLARISINLIKCHTSTEQNAGDLITKLQKLALCHYNLREFYEALDLYDEALRAEIGRGCLQSAAEYAAAQSLQEILKQDTLAASWSQLIRIRLKASLGNGNDSAKAKFIFDDESLLIPERGLLLEQQLASLISIVDQNGLSAHSRAAFQHLTALLLSIYNQETYPIRRLRVRLCILRALFSHPGLLEDSCLLQLLDEQYVPVPLHSKTSDIGLERFRPHLQECLNIAIQMRMMEPNVEAIGLSLTVWSRMLFTCNDRASLLLHIDELSDWTLQLQALADFLDMHGLEMLHASVLELLIKIYGIITPSLVSALASTNSQLGLQYARLGYTSKAGIILIKAQRYLENPEIHASEVIHWHLAFAEYAMSIDSLARSDQNLSIALQRFQENYASASGASGALVSRDRSKAFRTMADLYQVHSLLASANSHHAKALFFGRCAVRLCHKAWASLELSWTSKPRKASTETTGSTLEHVTEGLSEMTISTTSNFLGKDRSIKEPRGTAFWTLTPRYLRGLIHLSQLYAKNGLIPEARHYVGQAQRIANAIRAVSFVQQCLTLAGDLEVRSGNMNQGLEALLQSSEESAKLKPNRHFVNLQICLANTHSLKGAWPQAECTLNAARETVEELMALVSADDSVHKQPEEENLERALQSLTLGEKVPASRKATKCPIPGAVSRRTGIAGPKAPTIPTKPANQIQISLLVNMKIAIMQRLVYAALQQSELQRALSLLAEVTKQYGPSKDSVLRVLHNAQIDLHQALDSVSGDPVFCSLTESTISIPSTKACSPRRGKISAQVSPVKKGSIKKSIKKSPSGTISTAIAEGFVLLLQRMRDNICEVLEIAKETSSTATIHEMSDILVKVLMMLSAATPSQAQGGISSAFSAYVSNLARTTSFQRERLAIIAEKQLTLHQDLFTWPYDKICNDKGKLETRVAFGPLALQENHAPFMPASWRVLSISVNDAHDELCISKICSGQSPFMISLPLNRQHSRDGDEELFGFDQAKSELTEIVELANESTHTTHDLSARGAKSAWWEGRAALDARLKDFLFNIENIWLGGFRGLFSVFAQNMDLLSRFQQSLYHILDKHLPSRQKSGKGWVASHVALNPRVLELFVGLGNPVEAGDLAESLTDLLYYVVDILQFHGERNAYDEIDFDSIVVETCDALRHYHEAANNGSERIKSQHTILILDKSLHCFPWESLPCLHGQAVSRLPSFGCLLERVQQYQQQASSTCVSSPVDGLQVDRDGGSYVLNPAGDLIATQAMFEQPLQRLQNWTHVVGRVPDEDEMKSYLTDRDVFLYFGHGSGSQYVRSRTIKNLERCAVALLMGCSSGALTEAGDFEPYGTPMNYMHAGCPAMVATLWDVTDKDIDRFSDTVLQKWGLFRDAEPPPSGSPVKKARKPRGKIKEVTLSSLIDTPISLDQAVATGRDSCFLRYLNGAAPVVYGVPVFLR